MEEGLMNAEKHKVAVDSDVEERLRAALKAEAARCLAREPAALALRCRSAASAAPSYPPRFLVWTGGAAAAALVVLALCWAGPHRDSVDGHDAPAVVLPLKDTTALFAGLPKFPPLRPPNAPARLVADRVVVVNAP
jgi:hypothetical protein